MKSTVTCASDLAIKEYIELYQFVLMTATNFVDWDLVEPFKGPLKTTFEWIKVSPLQFSETDFKVLRYKLKEQQIYLEDSVLQILTEPEEF